MADRSLFSGWTERQLLDYIRDNGGSTQFARNRDDLISECASLAQRAEAQATRSRASVAPSNTNPYGVPAPSPSRDDPYGVQAGGVQAGGRGPYNGGMGPGGRGPYGGGMGMGMGMGMGPAGPYPGGPGYGPPPPRGPPPSAPPYCGGAYPSGPPGSYGGGMRPSGPPGSYGGGMRPPGPPGSYGGGACPPSSSGPCVAGMSLQSLESSHPGYGAQGFRPSFDGRRPSGAVGQYGMTNVPPPMPSGGNAKKALLIGINYVGTSSQLNGCMNDAKCLRYMLQKRYGFLDQNILMMTDEQPDPLRRPTKRNLLMGMEWLVTGQKAGDSLFFSYSGHGSQQRDPNGDEDDGMNETICPLDFKSQGMIADDDLNRMLVNPIQKGVKLHAVVDACHSGSVMDLPYSASVDDATGRAFWRSEYSRPTRLYKGTAGGFVVSVSAAQDSQTAADTSRLSGGVSTGAATYCLIQAVERRGSTMTYGDLLLAMDAALRQALGAAQSATGPAALSGVPGMGGLFGASGGGGGLMGGFLEALLGGGLGGTGGGVQRPNLASAWTFDMGYKFNI